MGVTMTASLNNKDENIENTIETDVLIIGGGVTGAGIMRDLSLRGLQTFLIDKFDLCSGASGGNHGLLHSGARYVTSDIHSAIECRKENAILKHIASQCIEDTGGLFVSVDGDDLDFGSKFSESCTSAGIDCDAISLQKARELEPQLSKKIAQAFRVPDATVDPFRMALLNVAHAEQLGDSTYQPHAELIKFTIVDGNITSATCLNRLTNNVFTVRAKQYVNASGAWAMNVAKIAGCNDVNLLYSKGTLLVSHDRLTHHVINRLRPPCDGDILVPGGTVSILGTTSQRIDNLETVKPTVAEVDKNVIEGAAMLPALATTRYIRAFSGVRPLLQSQDAADDREATRGFALFDHETENLSNFCTITGGKLTTYRLMAEKCSDLVAKRLDNTKTCATATTPLLDDDSCRWTEPGASPKYWYKANDPNDIILCECEMVPQSAIDEIVKDAPGAKTKMSLEAISLRSRAGKGPCQGSFCGIRLASYLYDCDHYEDNTGLIHMRDFFNERFKGMRTVIWGQQAAQMELAEALHCGLLGLDNIDNVER